MRDRENDPERDRQAIARRLRPIDADSDGIGHGRIMPSCAMRSIAAALCASTVLFVLSPFPRAQTGAEERGTLILHYVQKAIGAERYTIARDGGALTLRADFDFTDRGGRTQLASTLRTRDDFTPIHFTAK